MAETNNPQDECPFCFSERKADDRVCNTCLFPLAGDELQQQQFFSQHERLRKSITVSSWWINMAQQFVLGAALACVAVISLSRAWLVPATLMLYGLAGSFNLILYFLPSRFTQVSAAVAGTMGILFVAAALWLYKGGLWVLIFSGAYIAVMGITFYVVGKTSDQLRQHLIRGGGNLY
ncbi:MAG: hypothetical protein MUC87_15235 [Bacteroidia bacterium]|jgi:hypothetical protein|nr:hypothetical protein [Bacteroidia bacterium]